MNRVKPTCRIIYEDMKDKIVKCELKPGISLIEEKLAVQYGTSRTPIRDALKYLNIEGFVEIIPRKGAFVKNIMLKDIEDIFMIREALEGICARVSTRAITQEQLDDLESCIREDEKKLKNIANEEIFTGTKIHQVILSTAGNQRIIDIINNYNDHIDRLHYLAARLPGRLEKAVMELRSILEALKSRTENRVEKAIRLHIRNTKEDIINAIFESKKVVIE